MSYISEYIDNLNKNERKALSIFLTAGYPYKDKFVDLARNILDAGADMLELGIPFSDPLADGPIIQASSKVALDNGVTIKDVLSYSKELSEYSAKPIILMGYANPIRKYGINNFMDEAVNSGVKGLIVPDIPLDEHETFFEYSNPALDLILLTTPTSSDERIVEIDSKSRGFVYCVSVAGTTGIINDFNKNTGTNLSRTYSLVKNNKMMIGFGISKPEDITGFSPFCDGVIVGSKVIKSLLEGDSIEITLKIVSEFSAACTFR